MLADGVAALPERVVMLVGRRVVVNGLVGRPELNGTQGVAQSFDPASGRYNVRMDTGVMVALKPQNVVENLLGSRGNSTILSHAVDGDGVSWYYMGPGDLGPQGPLSEAAICQLYDSGTGLGAKSCHRPT